MHPSIVSSAVALALHPVSGPIPVLAATLVASAWQGVLLTCLVALCLRLLPGLSSAARSAVWTGVLVTVACLPPFLSRAEQPGSGHLAVLHVEETVSTLLVALWAAGSALRLVQLTASAVRLRSVLRRASPVDAGVAVGSLLRDGARPARLCISSAVERPSVAGFFHPCILVPADLFRELSEADLSHIVLHEMQHLRRRDDWLNLLQQISLVLFPLNSALLWLNRRLSLERELACDEGVLQTTRARKAYAACLARVAESSLVRRGITLALGVLGDWKRRPELVERVERILATPKEGMGRSQMRFATGVVLAGVFGSGALLAHCPTPVSFVPAVGPAFAQSVPAAVWLGSPEVVPRTVLAKAILPARPAFVNATMPARPARMTRASATRLSHRMPLRAAVRGRVRSRTAPWVVLTDWQQPATPVHTAPASIRLAPLVIEDSQIWYTAVAWRGGWIVVQL